MELNWMYKIAYDVSRTVKGSARHLTCHRLKHGVLCRLYSSGSKLSEGAVMAADASLPLGRISGAMHAMFNMLSKPDTLPELSALQVAIL